MRARREPRTTPAPDSKLDGDQRIHQSMPNHDGVTVLRRQRVQSLSHIRGAPTSGLETLHTRAPAAEPRRARDSRPYRGGKSQRGAKGARQRSFANILFNCRRRCRAQQLGRVARAPERTHDHEPRFLRDSLELGARPGGWVERRIALRLEPGGEAMTGDRRWVQQRPAVSCQDDSRHRECFVRRPSHTSSSAGKKTTRISWSSWRESRPAGSPSGVQKNR